MNISGLFEKKKFLFSSLVIYKIVRKIQLKELFHAKKPQKKTKIHSKNKNFTFSDHFRSF